MLQTAGHERDLSEEVLRHVDPLYLRPLLRGLRAHLRGFQSHLPDPAQRHLKSSPLGVATAILISTPLIPGCDVMKQLFLYCEVNLIFGTEIIILDLFLFYYFFKCLYIQEMYPGLPIYLLGKEKSQASNSLYPFQCI